MGWRLGDDHLVAAVPAIAERCAGSATLRVDWRSRSHFGAAGTQLHRCLFRGAAGRADSGSAVGPGRRGGRRTGQVGAARRGTFGGPDDVRGGRRRRRIRQGAAGRTCSTLVEVDLVDLDSRSGFRPGRDTSVGHRIFAVHIRIDSCTGRGRDHLSESDGQFRADDGGLFCRVRGRRSAGHHLRVVAAVLSRHGFTGRGVRAATRGRARRAHQPGVVFGATRAVAAVAGEQHPRVFGGHRISRSRWRRARRPTRNWPASI